jgi:hypothetical protein
MVGLFIDFFSKFEDILFSLQLFSLFSLILLGLPFLPVGEALGSL